jgi:hypothetical protein
MKRFDYAKPKFSHLFVMPPYSHFSAEAKNGKTKGKNFKLVYGKFYFILEG